MAEPAGDGTRWRARPLVAAAIVLATFALPVACSIAVAVVLTHLVATASPAQVLGWLAVMGASTIVFLACERLTRRAQPLVVLLRSDLVFPGRAPRRLHVAQRLWTAQTLGRRNHEVPIQAISDDPIAAAEQLLMMAAAVNAHDHRTRGHADRVRAFADLIGEELQLSDGDRARLRWGALLHDVGKLTVHSDILSETAPSDHDRETVRWHPLEGARLIAPLAPWLETWADTVADHHERFDGGGYPFGLAGSEISTGGRIVAVADAYDAMTSVHGYKRPLSADAARTQLAAYAGAQFDPVIVRAFLAVPESRLFAVAPLTGIGTLSFGRVGLRLTQIANTVGRVGVTALATAACVVALLAGQRGAASITSTHSSVAHGSVSHNSRGGAVGPRSLGAFGNGHPTLAGGAGVPSAPPSNLAPETGSTPSTTGVRKSRSAAAGLRPVVNQPAGGGTDAGTGSTLTAAPGSPSPIPTTTIGGTIPAGPTTTSTTDPPPPPPPPPPVVSSIKLSATSGCQAFIPLPEISLSWVADPTLNAKGYVIFRGPDSNSLSYEETVSGSANTSLTDVSVSGFNTTYWYEVEAIGSDQAKTSDPISVTTPPLCLSAVHG